MTKMKLLQQVNEAFARRTYGPEPLPVHTRESVKKVHQQTVNALEEYVLAVLYDTWLDLRHDEGVAEYGQSFESFLKQWYEDGAPGSLLNEQVGLTLNITDTNESLADTVLERIQRRARKA